MSLTRRSLALALVAAPAAIYAPAAVAQARLSKDDEALIDRAVAYLEGLTEARAQFVQTDARGGTTRGVVYLKRPGKARFEYAAPSGLLVVSDGSTVGVADSRLKTFDRYPLSSTPLSLFLARNIRLDRGVQVTQVRRLADDFTLTARDVRKETAGEITLSFAASPIALTGWTVTDAQRRTTRVQLSGLQRASGLDAGLFVQKDPRRS